MTNKLQAALQLADDTARQVTGSYQAWTAFLTTAARLYKYPFPEQLMIYAQRPDATACAEWDFWNQRMRRYIRRGSKGIALIDASQGRPVLRYVFDVSDTGRRDNGLNPNLWQYRPEHHAVVAAALEGRFEVPGRDSLPAQLENIALRLAAEYWDSHQVDILRIVDGSFLEGYDVFNIGAAFRSAAAVSITYTLLSRCGLDPDEHFRHEDFLSVFDFNTRDSIVELGTAVSQSSEQVLRQIEVTVKQYEREKIAERSVSHDQELNLHPSGGLPVSQSGPAGAAGEGPGQVREDAPVVLEGAPSGPVQPPVPQRDPVQPPAGDRGRGQQPVGDHDAPAGESGGGHGAAESQGSVDVGGADEQLQGPGGGNYFVGAGLQLSFVTPEIPSQREQMEAIQEAESADALSAFSVPQADVDRALRRYGGKMRIFALYQQDLSRKDVIGAIKKEFGTGGRSIQLLDGTEAFMDYRPNTGLEFWRTPNDKKFIVKWPAVEKRIRQMITEGSYLSTAEMEKYLSDHLEEPPAGDTASRAPEAPAPVGAAPMPANMDFRTEYAVVKKAHPNDIVLYQLGDFYEMFGPDARVAAHELDLMLTQRNLPDVGRAAMCGFPAQQLDERVQKLRARHDVTVSSIGVDGNRLTVSYLSVEHEARNTREAEVPAPEESEPVHVPEALPPIPAPAPAREATQEDIDAALQAWNGDAGSKRAVASYMADHAREKDTAAWLCREYGGGLPAFPVKLSNVNQYQHLPWPKVQRRIAQLVKEDRFFAEAELDHFADVDTAAVREQLEQGPVPEPPPTVRQIYERYKSIVMDLVLTDRAYRNACKNSDRETAIMEGHEAVKRAALTITAPEFMRLYYDMAGAHNRLHREIIDETYSVLSQSQQEQAEAPGQPVPSRGDAIATGSEDAVQEFTGAADLPPHDPLAPPYKAGDTVYLDKTAFEITDISASEVQLRDPALPIPLLRAESKENFERQLHLDPRNSHITCYLPADLAYVNDDIQEVLTKHLLTDRDKGYISGWIRSGENNRGLAMRLSGALANRNHTVTLETGDSVDYVASTIRLEVDIQDKFNTRLAMSWDEIAPVLRAFWLQELYGFTHELVQREPVKLEGKLSYQAGDKVAFAYGDHDVSGTIEYIGDLGIRINTGPYAWSHQLVERDFFEDAVRHDERNAGLFTPEVPEQAAPEVPAQEAPETGMGPEASPGNATLYPGDKNGVPYDIVVQRLRFDEPEQAQPEALPARSNFRITDDHLGVGSLREKFRRNMDAINTLQAIELEDRAATPAEQEILSRYVGWGGLPQAFDENKGEWANEFLELQAALTPEEYTAARASTLNAHYTSPVVIKAIYEAIDKMGFKSGNILEPSCGVGNFFGLLPESMAASKLYGVELDSITGRIAQQLYPQAHITVRGYEKTSFPRDFFDLAVGNVPFGQYSVSDREYNKLGFNIHNYFFAKTLDRVRPGGVVAFVTSRYTLDSKDATVRKYLAARADLLGAIRLPNNAFRANAGTEVVSDIIFLQKRDTPAVEEPVWVQTGENADGFRINRYFIEHPEMILGRPSAESTQYGRQDFTVEPIQGLQLADQLHDAVKYIRGEYREAAPPELDENIREMEITSIPANPDVKNYSYAIVDGEIYYRENSVMVKPALTATARERVTAMIGLRDCVRELIDLQMDEFTTENLIHEKQGELDRLYNVFSAKFGLVNDRANRLAFDRDSSYYLLCSLEVLDDEGRLERKADMFTKRTIKQNTRVTSVETAMDALAVSIGERARVDMPFMAQLTGKSEAELEQELTGVIFRDIRCAENPDLIPKAFVDLDSFPLVTADEYLSGNVRQKLRMAQALHDVMPPDRQQRIQPNVEALTAAQPKDLDASEIEVRLGTDWIDKKYIQQFMYETLKTPSYLRGKIKVNRSKHTTEWAITCKGSVSDNDIAACTTYGTIRANAYRILEDSLNLRDVRIYDTVEDPDGRERRVLNARETTLAAQKQQALRDAFKDWIWKDPGRRQTLVAQYNEEMNSIRPREYDGSRIVFSGINPEIKLQPHQVNAIAHVLYGGNTLLAHEVGAGKTFEMIAAAMESKRLGLCHKSIFVVPNHLTGQTASEFLRLYPSANILVTTNKDFETRKRKKFCARIATGDYDAVIIGHSQFEKIPISPERQERLLQEQIMDITEGIQELKDSSAERFTVKQLERTKRKLEANLKKLLDDPRKDNVVTFEQLGVDMMFVDESDHYKNLYFYTKMRNVAGLATSVVEKSSDMFAKCRYLDEITKNRGVIFATGTPISNSMAEMFTIQRYLQYDRLQQMGMAHFDSWASRFGETTTALELAPEGTGYRAKTRLAKFFNLPELMNLFKEVADIKTADQLNLPTPEVEYHTIASKPTLIQQAMVKELSGRARLVHTGQVDQKRDNMLKITNDGRDLGLDQRVFSPTLPDEPGTKVNRCVENILHQWRAGDGKKLTQLVFCDISTPKASPSKRKKKGAVDKLDNPTLHMLETAIPLKPEKPFTIYEDIRQKLIAGGMRPEQVAFIHEAKTDVQKKELFAKVRSGQVRVLIGSTKKMGAGTNVQDKLIALHDLDCPWRPRDLTQRKGRIERRGNGNEKVHVYRYVTEGTFDAYLWQTVENKQKFISQIMTSKSPARTCEDVDEAALSYAEIKALCAGDPRIKERMELDVDVSKLKIMKSAHQSQQFQMEDNLLKYFPEQIAQHQGFIEGLEADMKTLAEHPHPLVVKEKPKPAKAEQVEAETAEAASAPPVQDETAATEVIQGFAGMVVQGETFADKEEAGKALLSAYLAGDVAEMVEIGSYRGFTIFTEVRNFQRELVLKGEMTHRAVLGLDPVGALVRIDHALDKMPERLAALRNQLENLFDQREAAKAEAGKPFPREDELREKSARLAELDVLLNIDGSRSQGEQARSARPSVLDSLKRPNPLKENSPSKPDKDKPKSPQQER